MFIDPLGLELPISGDKDGSFPPGTQRGPFTWRFIFRFQRDKGHSESILLASAVSHGTLIQSNQYANTLLFGGTLPSNNSPFVTQNIFSKNVLRDCDLINLLISMASSKIF